MFIQTQSTPNPLSLMFYPGNPVMEVGSADFPNSRSAMNSPLAKALYGIDGELVLQVILKYAKVVELLFFFKNKVQIKIRNYTFVLLHHLDVRGLKLSIDFSQISRRGEWQFQQFIYRHMDYRISDATSQFM